MRFRASRVSACGLSAVASFPKRRHGGERDDGVGRLRRDRDETSRRAMREGRWHDTHLLKSSTRYSISCGRGERGEGQDRRRLRVREIRQRSDHGRRARLSTRTVVAFAKTCCIMASFSAGESLDMSTGVPCCAIATPAARRRSGVPAGFRSKTSQLARRSVDDLASGTLGGGSAKRHVSGPAFCSERARPTAE